MMKLDGIEIVWLKHDAFKIESEGVVVYIDPYELKRGEKADLVLITHDHFDHLHADSLRVIGKADTVYIAPKQCQGKLTGTVRLVEAGDEVTEKGITVKAVAAYNVRADRQGFHPKSYGGVGYLLTVQGKVIYHAGDTDCIPEMSQFGTVDLALLPVSGTYVMDQNEAAEAVKAIKPKKVVPMHFGAIVGDRSNAEAFAKLVKGLTEVEILSPEA